MFLALDAKVLYVVFVILIVFGVFEESADFVTADIGVSLPGFGRRTRAVRRLRLLPAHYLL